MTRLFVGYKPGVGGAVKVMRYDSDDPLSEPNSHYGRYLFNSETTKIGYIERFEQVGWVSGAANDDVTFYGGSTINNCDKAVWRHDNSEVALVFTGRMIGRSYPVVSDHRAVKALGSKIPGPGVTYNQTDEDFNNFVGYNITSATYSCVMLRAVPSTFAEHIGNVTFSDPIFTFVDTPDGGSDTLISIFDLPAGNDAMPSAPAGASGTRNTLITPSAVKIGKGGVNADTSNIDRLIIDSDRAPIKVVRAGEVTIAAGSSTDVLSPVTLTSSCYVDYMVWDPGGAITIPQAISAKNVGGQEYQMAHAIFSDRVRFYNDGDHSLRVRYMICWDDGQTSSGGSAVFRTLSGYQQIKRPGSSDSSPKSKDILLDTRFFYPPIIAEGYLDHSDFTESPTSTVYGEDAKTVSWSNDGSWVPFLKYYVHRNRGSTDTSLDDRESITHPWAKVLRSSRSDPKNNHQARDGTVAVLTDTSVKFHMARNNPWRFQLDGSGFVAYDNRNRDRPSGIRYYVFAIPLNF